MILMADKIKKRFIANCLIACTRILELYNLDSNGERRFKYIVNLKLELELWRENFTFAMMKDFKIYKCKEQHIITLACSAIMKNHKLIEEITGRPLKAKEIFEFISQ